MVANHLIRNILNDLKVELGDEFDRNFERKGFFGQQWPPHKFQNNRGSLMMQSGKLRGSIRKMVKDTTVVFTTSWPYAKIHNEGGSIKVTSKMKKFFWYKYNQTNDEQWKWLALKKTESKINIPQRPFIANAPEIRKITSQIIDNNVYHCVTDIIRYNK